MTSSLLPYYDILTNPPGAPAIGKVESGSNANGSWEKTYDGSGELIKVRQQGLVTGSWTFPVEFPDTNIIMGGAAHGLQWAYVYISYDPTTTGVTIHRRKFVSPFNVLSTPTFLTATWLKGS